MEKLEQQRSVLHALAVSGHVIYFFAISIANTIAGVMPSTRIKAYEASNMFCAVSAESPDLHLPVSTLPLPTIADLFPLLEDGAGEFARVQPTMSEVIPKLNERLKGSCLYLMDTYKKVSFNNRKPDIVIYPRNQVLRPDSLPSEYFIILVGDIKGRRQDASFTKEEQGELETFLSELLELFVDREYVIGFLTDGHFVQFMCLHREPRKLCVSPVLSLKTSDGTDNHGARYLASLLYTEPHNLGANIEPLVVDGKKKLTVTKCLGAGSSAMVWEVRSLSLWMV